MTGSRDSVWTVARVAPAARTRVQVTTAAERAAADAAAIAAGIPSRALMRAAAVGSVAEIGRRYPGRLTRGVAVFAGSGNNGGDAWVVAGLLGAAGVRVRVAEVAEPRTPEAIAERDRALPFVTVGAPSGAERLVIDGLLGVGGRPIDDGPLAEAVERIAELRARGATVVSLDIPSGCAADDGRAERAVAADCTVAFGSVPRGVLLRRDLAGAIAVLDIGLGVDGAREGAAGLVDAAWVRRGLPFIPADAHKGTRGKLAVVGGAPGMAGAAVLAARAALASGIGLVQAVVGPECLPLMAAGAAAALARAWPAPGATDAYDAADAVVIGPGLGRDAARALVEQAAEATRAPLLLDADALNAFAGDLAGLGRLAAGRAVLTPHAVELARLLDVPATVVAADRFTHAQALADATGAVVLAKGVPTIVAAPGDAPLVVPRGTPALATGGSGDVLAGIVGTLLAQGMRPVEAAAAAAWIHGVAAERAGADRGVRGTTLDDVLVALPTVWDVDEPAPVPPVLAELPAVPA